MTQEVAEKNLEMIDNSEKFRSKMNTAICWVCGESKWMPISYRISSPSMFEQWHYELKMLCEDCRTIFSLETKFWKFKR
jgi:hypothetical protein